MKPGEGRKKLNNRRTGAHKGLFMERYKHYRLMAGKVFDRI
jgi:hypothetical protein